MANDPFSNHDSPSRPSRRPGLLVFSVVGGIVGIGVLLLLLVQSLEITIETGTPADAPNRPPTSNGAASPGGDGVGDRPPALPTLPAELLEWPQARVAGDGVASDGGGAIAPDMVLLGGLRVSNQTIHPVRVALLAQGGDQPLADSPQIASTSEGSAALGTRDPYNEPIHWDFAPGEGAATGLPLGTAEGKLQIQQGDVITAFAQDGSQWYWGPYAVGTTGIPQWDADTEEWVLILESNTK